MYSEKNLDPENLRIWVLIPNRSACSTERVGVFSGKCSVLYKHFGTQKKRFGVYSRKVKNNRAKVVSWKASSNQSCENGVSYEFQQRNEIQVEWFLSRKKRNRIFIFRWRSLFSVMKTKVRVVFSCHFALIKGVFIIQDKHLIPSSRQLTILNSILW